MWPYRLHGVVPCLYVNLQAALWGYLFVCGLIGSTVWLPVCMWPYRQHCVDTCLYVALQAALQKLLMILSTFI